MTNADRIRQMTDEELWVLLFKIQRCDYCRLNSDCEMTDEECKKSRISMCARNVGRNGFD
jgi:hypothetical protein